MSIWLAVLIAWLVMSLIMAGLWRVQTRTHNAGIVDIAWSFGTGMCAAGFALSSDGGSIRRTVVAILAGLWALRLGGHLVKRVLSEPEDGRYQMLRERWGQRTSMMMFGFYQLQAFWAVMFALPMLAASHNRSPVGVLDGIGIALWAASLIGEGVADWQLARFRGEPSNRGKVCRVGLWSWSRHPNYFFEWIHWWAYILMAVGSPLAWLSWLGAGMMFYFLTRVTGIPLTEARALKSRGDAYLNYQHEVSAFVPMPPRRSA